MKPRVAQLSALPYDLVTRHPDVLLAAGVAAIVSMLILPLPALAVDGLLAANLALAAVVLVAVLLSKRPLALSTFPTLLLITTLFRLALNVSTTRMILAQGTAGEVVSAFGRFVIRGDVVVGLVIFLVITLVQFLVIGKGAERVAEVGARFTLDAMPGKQMSIDAAVRSGAIDEREAQDKREDLGRESQFYGAMDGAMKFVKGDAIAGLVITALNLVAGLVIGVARNDLGFAEAAETYCILTVGDGLVSQIPALLITLSAGVLTTRVSAKDAQSSLGRNLRDELFSSPKVLAIGGVFALALGLVPGLPLLPFALIAAGLGGASALRRRFLGAEAGASETRTGPQAQMADMDQEAEDAQAQETLLDRLLPAAKPLEVDLELGLVSAVGAHPGALASTMSEVLQHTRNSHYAQYGVRLPPIGLRPGTHLRRRGALQVRVKEVPVHEGIVDPDRLLVLERPERLAKTGILALPGRCPVSGRLASFVSRSHAGALGDLGINVYTPEEQIGLHILAAVRARSDAFVGIQEVGEQLTLLEKAYPTLVRETVPKVVSLATLVEILRRLVAEEVNVRDLKTILECLARCGPHASDPAYVTERVRAALCHQITHQHVGASKTVSAVLLDGVIEDTVQDAIVTSPEGTYLALDPQLRNAILDAAQEALRAVHAAGVRPVVLTQPSIRWYVKELLGDELGPVAVLSYAEMPKDLTVQPLGRVTLGEDLVAA